MPEVETEVVPGSPAAAAEPEAPAPVTPASTLEELAGGEGEAAPEKPAEEGTPAPAPGEADKPAEPEEPEGGKPANRADKDWGKLRAERRELRAKVADLEAKLNTQAPPPPAEPVEYKPTPFEEKEPTLDDFAEKEDPYSALMVALGAHGARKANHEIQEQSKKERIEGEAKRQSEAKQTEQAKFVQAAAEQFVSKRDEFKKTTPDWDDTIDELREEIKDIPASLQYVLMESERGPEVLYYLGKHTDEAAAILKLSPGKQAISIGKIEAKLEAKKKPEKPPQPPPNPAPVLRSQSGTQPKRADEETMVEYKARRVREAQRR